MSDGLGVQLPTPQSRHLGPVAASARPALGRGILMCAKILKCAQIQLHLLEMTHEYSYTC